MAKLSTLDWLVLILVTLGAVNWGLVGLFQLDLVDKILGTGTLAMVVYVLVGVAGLVNLYNALK